MFKSKLGDFLGGKTRSGHGIIPAEKVYVISKDDHALYVGQTRGALGKRLHEHIKQQSDIGLAIFRYEESAHWDLTIFSVPEIAEFCRVYGVGEFDAENLDGAEACLIQILRPFYNVSFNSKRTTPMYVGIGFVEKALTNIFLIEFTDYTELERWRMVAIENETNIKSLFAYIVGRGLIALETGRWAYEEAPDECEINNGETDEDG